MLFQSATYGIFFQLGEKLRADPTARCNTSLQCAEMVKRGGAVYTAVIIAGIKMFKIWLK